MRTPVIQIYIVRVASWTLEFDFRPPRNRNKKEVFGLEQFQRVSLKCWALEPCRRCHFVHSKTNLRDPMAMQNHGLVEMLFRLVSSTVWIQVLTLFENQPSPRDILRVDSIKSHWCAIDYESLSHPLDPAILDPTTKYFYRWSESRSSTGKCLEAVEWLGPTVCNPSCAVASSESFGILRCGRQRSCIACRQRVSSFFVLQLLPLLLQSPTGAIHRRCKSANRNTNSTKRETALLLDTWLTWHPILYMGFYCSWMVVLLWFVAYSATFTRYYCQWWKRLIDPLLM